MNIQSNTPVLFEGNRAEVAAFLSHPSRQTYYTYVLCRPNGKPFYIGKGKGQRALMHELEALRDQPKLEGNPLKGNVIRKIHRNGGALIYRIDQEFCDLDQLVCLEREGALIKQYGRLHENGILTNLAGGVGNPSESSPLSKERHAATLAGESEANPEKSVLNRYLKSFGLVNSTCIKPLSQFKSLVPTTPHPSPRKPSPRMCYALMASAVAHGLSLEAGVVIPRLFSHSPDLDDWDFPVPNNVTAIIERGVSRDILKAGLASLRPVTEVIDEAFVLDADQVRKLIGLVGENAARLRGLI